jgi:mono/diheme cytochrome c family protein
MTLFMIFAGFAVLTYVDAASAAAVAGAGSGHVSFGIQLGVLASLAMLLAAATVLFKRPLRAHGLVIALMCGASAMIVIAATRDVSNAQSIEESNTTPTAVVAGPEPAQATGERLFQELACFGCHRPDRKGIGPSLVGRLGRPLTDPGCGSLTVDEEYVRESILNPTASVLPGFAPIMPTYAGKLTEEQLHALVAYVKSLAER